VPAHCRQQEYLEHLQLEEPMRPKNILILVAAAALTACSDDAVTGSAQRQSTPRGPVEPVFGYTGATGCSKLRLSESAVYDDATGNFFAKGIAVIGDQVPLTFTSVVYTLDADWDRLLEGKNFKALQREEFTFENGDQLYVQGPVMSVPLSAPGMYDATGGSSKFVGGTGDFEGAHGNAFVKGVTMFAPGVASTSIAWYNGEICL
jgi:hypothetical protein